MWIDLNADVGEGVGVEADLMPWVTSANVSCGFHAGDVGSLVEALELAERHGVRVGAHPGYPDRAGFGRIEQPMDEGDLFHLGVYQLGALAALADVYGLSISYLKAHGALYNQACREEPHATGLLAVASHFGRLPVVGLPGSYLDAAAGRANIPFVREGYADRRYTPDGSLVPRVQPDALITDAQLAAEQAEWLVREKQVQTLCVHGDTPGAVELLRTVREHLIAKGYEIRAFSWGSSTSTCSSS